MHAPFTEPRFLTAAEIENIVDVVPMVAAAVREAGAVIRDEIKLSLTRQLEAFQLCPEQIPALRQWVLNQYVRSIIHPGDPVGMTAGEANGQPITQMTLNAFHHSGSKQGQAGLEAFRELLNLSRTRKNPITYLHFNNEDMDFNEAMAIRRQFEGITVSALLSDPVMGIEMRAAITPTGEPIPMAERGWWYPIYTATTGRTIPGATHYMRLTFDKLRLYTYSVTTTDVVNALNRDGIVCVPSPTSVGIIDVYPEERAAMHIFRRSMVKISQAINDDNSGILFLQIKVKPGLHTVVVSGIPGITDVVPMSLPTLSVVRGEEPYVRPERMAEFFETNPDVDPELVATTTRLWLDAIALQISGVTLTKLSKLITAVGGYMHDLEADPLYHASVRVTFPAAIAQERTALTILKTAVKAELDAEKVWLEANRTAQNRYPSRPPSAILRASQYVYAEASGINLEAVLVHPLINPRYTICNDYHEINRVRGLIAARNWIEYELFTLIKNSGSYISPTNITQIPNFMINMGVLVPITSRGVSRQGRGAFSEASFENVVDAFKRSATSGRQERIDNSSTCILFGKRFKVGTGSFIIGANTEILRATAELVRQRTVIAIPTINESMVRLLSDSSVTAPLVPQIRHADGNDASVTIADLGALTQQLSDTVVVNGVVEVPMPGSPKLLPIGPVTVALRSKGPIPAVKVGAMTVPAIFTFAVAAKPEYLFATMTYAVIRPPVMTLPAVTFTGLPDISDLHL